MHVAPDQYSIYNRGERELLLGVREREREWIIPFPKFRNGKGIEKTHSLNLGMGREWKKTIPKIREWEGNEKIYSQYSGTGREWNIAKGTTDPGVDCFDQ